MLGPLQAEEQLRAITAFTIGTGSTRKEDAGQVRQYVRDLERAATRHRPHVRAPKATPDVLIAAGIPVEFEQVATDE